jgi:adenylate kinase
MKPDNALLLSLHPRHAKKIFLGVKRLEFRRVWTSRPVSSIVVYATVPIQGIVGIARIKKVHRGSPTALWQLAQSLGGGLSRRELYSYFQGKKTGFAVELESVTRCSVPLDPKIFLKNFTPPQSFLHLDNRSLARIEAASKKQSPKGRVLFVAGVHGVGKTTLSSDYARKHGMTHKSASDLIRAAKESAIVRRGKKVADIPGNQQLLIESVRRITASGESFLLDGHFSLLNSAGKIEFLPTKVFADLNIDGVVLVQDSPKAIARRLASRDNSEANLEEIRKIQTLEIERSKAVGRELGLPVLRVEAFDERGFEEAVDLLIRV